MSNQLWMLIHAVILASLLALAHCLLKWLSLKESKGFFDLILTYWWLIGTSLGLFGLVFFYYTWVLRSHQIALLYPVYTGLSLLFVMLAGLLAFNEELNMTQLSGVVLIILGVGLISYRTV